MARAPRRPLPEAIVKRKKTGFTVPIRDWLNEQGEVTKHFGMRPWALYLLEAGGHTPHHVGRAGRTLRVDP